MPKRVDKSRWVVAVTAGFVAALSTGLTATSADSVAAPALHVKNGSEWTVKAHEGGCEVATFDSNGSFTASRNGDSGTWIGGSSSLTMSWTSGANSGLEFSGDFDSAEKKYIGNFTGSAVDTGAMIKGSLHRCS